MTIDLAVICNANIKVFDLIMDNDLLTMDFLQKTYLC
ncbi:MAG: hypothetical protein JWP78_439 [Mucilaginibacter sp.]|nr:hypothetical protein [Mucilaginibacter sp.]